MKILLLSLKYLHYPELGYSFPIKNSRLHFVNTYLQCKLTPLRYSNRKFSNIVADTWECNIKNYRNILNNDRFVRKMGYYYSDNKKKPKDIYTICSPKIMNEYHINLLGSTVYKSNVKILILEDCNLNDYFFSKFFMTEFNNLIQLRLNDNHLTNHSIKNMSKMKFSKMFEYLEIDYNNLDEDALRIIFSSDTFKSLVSLSIILKENRNKKKKISYEMLSNYPKLYTINCNKNIFQYDKSFIENMKLGDKINRSNYHERVIN